MFVAGGSTGTNGYDYAVIKYLSNGTSAWTNRYDRPSQIFLGGESTAKSLVVDRAGNVYTTGNSSVTNRNNSDYATIKYRADGTSVWTNRYDGPGNTNDFANALAVDSAGNVYVTGQSFGTNSFYDYATIKYLPDGTPAWTNRYDGPANTNDLANALAVDNAGNVYVTGSSSGANGLNDYATIKYLSDGTPAWTNRYDGPGHNEDNATALALDGADNIYVTGASPGTNGWQDYATIKYRSDGMPVWTNRYNGPGDFYDSAAALAVDSVGNVYVTGCSYDTNYNADYLTIKYLSAGTPVWTNRYDGLGSSDSPTALAVDGAGNVYVTGQSYETNDYPGYATIKYRSDGTPVWTNRYKGPGNIYGSAHALAVDGAGNVYVTGLIYGANSYDYVTIKYRADGTPVWTNRYDRPGAASDYANALAVDSAGNVYVAGYSYDAMGFRDFATIKYSAPTSPPVLVALPSSDEFSFHFFFDTLLGKVYTVEYKDSGDTNWHAQQSLPGVQAVQIVTNSPPPPPGIAARFFRVKEE